MKRLRNRRPLNPLEDIFAADQAARIVIAGGSGFLGQALAARFEKQEREVVILSRRPAPERGRIRTVVWDGRTVGDWAEELIGADAVVNMSGRSVACLYTPENKREIIDSRVESVRAIAEACARCPEPPKVIVQAASLAIYGDAGDRICDEDSPHGTGFSTEVCEAWEKEFFLDNEGPRRVALRIGFVLGRNGGALEPLGNLAFKFLGGSAGNGRQYISWLHLEDFCSMVNWSIRDPGANGAFNACTATPATNAEFMREVRRAAHRPWSPPIPAWAVKFGARYVMKVDPSLALTGRRCIPKRLLAEGFEFKHNNLEATLREMLWRYRGD